MVSGPFNDQTNPSTVLTYAAPMTNVGLNALNTAGTYANALSQGLSGLTGITITPNFPTGPDAPGVVTSTPPEATEVVWSVPATPSDFTGDLDVSDLFFDTFDATQPELLFPTAPEFYDNGPGDAPGVNTSYSLPTLSVSLPAVPDLLSISTVPFSGVNLPTFNEAAPEFTLVSPSIREYTPNDVYTSDLLRALQIELQDRIENGGTGLGQTGETAIWERGVEREARSAAQALAQLEQMESLGYALPPGMYLDARLKIQTEMDYASRGHSRDVMAESARLELDQVKHALTTATQLEGQLLEYTNSTEQRLFDSCKFVTDAGIQIYNAGVQAYGARVEAYRATAGVYESQIRGELAKVEVYKAQLEAERTKVEINQAKVALYEGQIRGALANVQVYEARIEGIKAVAELERNKILVYGENVKAYGARVNAYSAQVEAFRARVQGETAKQEGYAAAARAFGSQVEAVSKQIDARIAVYSGRIEEYKARWEGYKAQVAGEASRAQAVSAENQSKAAIYEATVRGDSSYNEVISRQWQATLDQNQRVAEIGVSAAKANADIAVSLRSISLDAAKVGAQVAAQIGAAALSTFHISGSYSQSSSFGNSNSYSGSESDSISQSVSTSTSTSTNTNYNYSV